MSAIVAADWATWPALRHTLGCFGELLAVGADHEVPGLLVAGRGVRRAASRIWSRCSSAIASSA